MYLLAVTWRDISPRASSRRLWAPTHRRFRSGPGAVPQAAQTIGACGTSALVTIGAARQNPFEPSCLPGGRPGFFSSGLPAFPDGAAGGWAPAAEDGVPPLSPP